MKHYGDITKLNGHELEIVDVITGGSPCQDLSVAGRRAGLAGERSGLFMEQIRIIKEMRDESRRRGDKHIRPRYMVWENVPGALTSGQPRGEDFRIVLEETARVADKDAVIPRPADGKWTQAGCIVGDGWSIAWRIHDAQFWGVPQRRKRIALVADFRGASAPEILFEREGVSGDFEPSQETRQGASAYVGRSVDTTGGGGSISFQERAGKPGGGKGLLIQDEHTGALGTCQHQNVCAIGFDPGATRDVGVAVYDECSKTISNGTCPGHHNGVAYGFDPSATRDVGVAFHRECEKTICAGSQRQGVVQVTPAVAYGIDRSAYNQGQNAQYNMPIEEDLEPPIVARGGSSMCFSYSQFGAYTPDDTARTITNRGYKDGLEHLRLERKK